MTRVDYRLRPGGAPKLRMRTCSGGLAGKEGLTLMEVAAAVREIRRAKGMLMWRGMRIAAAQGSFFKNPIVGSERGGEDCSGRAWRRARFRTGRRGEGKVKVPAAWLLEQAGFVKGYGVGPAGISTRHTLALTNRGGATFADVERLQDEIVRGVRERLGLRWSGSRCSVG